MSSKVDNEMHDDEMVTDEADSDSSEDSEDGKPQLTTKNFVVQDSELKLSVRKIRNAQRETQLEAVVFDRVSDLSAKRNPQRRAVSKPEIHKEDVFFFEDRNPVDVPVSQEKGQSEKLEEQSEKSARAVKSESTTVWHDEDDYDESSKDFKQLRRRFEDAYGRNASWASEAASMSKRSRRRLSSKAKAVKIAPESDLDESEDIRPVNNRLDSEESESDDDFDYDKECRTFVRKPVILQKGTLLYERMRDVNRECEFRGRLSAVEFHSQLPLALVGAETGCAFGLFRVDGRRNEKLHTAYLDGFGVSCARFNVATNEVLLGACRKNYYVYDMPSGKLTDITTMNAGQSRFRERHVTTTTESFEVSPDGQFIVFLDRFTLHVVSARTKEWVGQLRASSSVQSIAFGPYPGRTNYALYALGGDGVVSVWDVAARRCIHSFTDVGCVRASALSVSRSGSLLATGHSTGIINIYDANQCLESRTPSPRCTVQNLVTRCTSLRFNATDELLCAASNRVRKGIRLVHVPTSSVFSNFPSNAENALAHVEALAFSPASGYLSIATNTGKSLLYRLKHYRNY